MINSQLTPFVCLFFAKSTESSNSSGIILRRETQTWPDLTHPNPIWAKGFLKGSNSWEVSTESVFFALV